MEHEKLGGDDSAWLHMESPTSPMVVSGVLELGGPLPIERVRPLVERIARIPRFCATIAEPRRGVGVPSWAPVANVDLDYHLEHVQLEVAGDGALRAFIGTAVTTTLDRTRPLWRVYVIDRPDAGTTILFRVHHALADGFALLALMLSLCDPDPALEERLRLVHPAVAIPTLGSAASALRRLVALPADTETHLKKSLSGEKRVAWTRPIAFADVHDVAHATNASVNDVIVAAVAGALSRELRRRGDQVPGLHLHAMLPVNLRQDTNATRLGNHLGLVMVDLPVSIDDPIARVAAAKHRMDVLKSTPETLVAHELLRGLGVSPRQVEDTVVSFFARKTSLVLTNVPGPKVRLKLGGVPISRIAFWVPQAGRLGLGISALTYAGDLTFGVIADTAVLSHPETLAADLSDGLDDLVRAVSAGKESARHVPLHA